MRGTWWVAAGVVVLILGVLTASATATEAVAEPLELGIYTGGYAGGGSLDGAPDDPARVIRALDDLQAGPGFLVREYVGYDGKTTDGTDSAQYLRYLGSGRRMDLVLGYPGQGTPLAGWLRYVRNEVRFAGPFSASISLGVDVNLSAANDPSVLPAVVAGIEAAKDQARRLGYGWLRVGFDEALIGRGHRVLAVTDGGGRRPVARRAGLRGRRGLPGRVPARTGQSRGPRRGCDRAGPPAGDADCRVARARPHPRVGKRLGHCRFPHRSAADRRVDLRTHRDQRQPGPAWNHQLRILRPA